MHEKFWKCFTWRISLKHLVVKQVSFKLGKNFFAGHSLVRLLVPSNSIYCKVFSVYNGLLWEPPTVMHRSYSDSWKHIFSQQAIVLSNWHWQASRVDALSSLCNDVYCTETTKELPEQRGWQYFNSGKGRLKWDASLRPEGFHFKADKLELKEVAQKRISKDLVMTSVQLFLLDQIYQYNRLFYSVFIMALRSGLLV